mmetsp:Transcript_18188/g.45497  ORF Transcript_18188/g.45497 Transcript_18188/m.45497 type:complete len:80 (+) Transcript_18188:218-457(+)
MAGFEQREKGEKVQGCHNVTTCSLVHRHQIPQYRSVAVMTGWGLVFPSIEVFLIFMLFIYHSIIPCCAPDLAAQPFGQA